MTEQKTARRSATWPFSLATHDRLFTLHAWMGVVGGVLLHVIFFTGVFSLFKVEIGAWQDPARVAAARGDARAASPDAMLTAAMRALPDVDRLGFTIPEPGARMHAVHVHYRRGEAHDERNVALRGPVASSASMPSSVLADFLYELHFLHPVPYGTYIAGIASMLMFIALVSGLAIHLRDLPKHAARFRFGKAARVAWNDAHRVLGTMGLPFQLVFAFSGVALCLGAPVLGVQALTTFDGDRAAAVEAFGYGRPPSREPVGRTIEPVALEALLQRARASVPGFTPDYVIVERPRDASSVVTLFGGVEGVLFARSVVAFDAGTGAEVFASTPRTLRLPGRIAQIVFGLHFATFGGVGLRAFYALLSLATCVTVLSGNAIWLYRRVEAGLGRGPTLLLKLSTAGAAAVVCACAAMFVANHVVPVDGVAIALDTIEVGVFSIVLAIATAYALAHPSPRTSTRHLLALAAASFALAVALDLVRDATGALRHEIAVTNALLLGLAIACGVIAKRITPA